jgi:hypothetical protein
MRDHETFCGVCASLSFKEMSTAHGQVHHDNWTSLAESSAQGCRLCSFFLSDRDADEDLVRPQLNSGECGPIVLRIGWSSLYISTLGETMENSYKLVLPEGMIVLWCIRER